MKAPPTSPGGPTKSRLPCGSLLSGFLRAHGGEETLFTFPDVRLTREGSGRSPPATGRAQSICLASTAERGRHPTADVSFLCQGSWDLEKPTEVTLSNEFFQSVVRSCLMSYRCPKRCSHSRVFCSCSLMSVETGHCCQCFPDL